MRLEVSVEADAPRQAVWELLTRWERQADWMVDALAVEVLTPARTGEGVTIRCRTGLLGVGIDDVLRVTRWEPPARLVVAHLGGLIAGEGRFELAELPGGRTRIDWWEEVAPPLGKLGDWAATTLVAPWLRRIFARSLRNFAKLLVDTT